MAQKGWTFIGGYNVRDLHEWCGLGAITISKERALRKRDTRGSRRVTPRSSQLRLAKRCETANDRMLAGGVASRVAEGEGRSG